MKSTFTFSQVAILSCGCFAVSKIDTVAPTMDSGVVLEQNLAAKAQAMQSFH